MKTFKRQIGDLGEDIVCLYLKKKGFRILERNYLRKWGEIDIVAENGSIISFIEVKTVTREIHPHDGSRGTTNDSDGFKPQDNVHSAKLERLHRAIQTYLLDHRVPDSKPWKIDVASVYLDISAKKARVEMFDNVVL